jgi:3-hydroxyisobutyrate dehydrogenase-like beta-hydroxyacid dehydrogenase
MNIGFIGLGNMGSGMAGCLLKSGHQLRVWNRTVEKAAPLAAAGAIVCKTPAEAAENTPIVISCLMDDDAIHTVFGGADGVIAHMSPNAIHVGASTISPECADWLAEQHTAQGSRYLSGPVLGRPDSAAAGTLLQFLAGDAGGIEEVQPVCKAFASQFVPLPGPARVANLQKLCTNFFIASLIEVFAECYTFADKSGASSEVLAQFFQRSFAHPGLQGYARRMKNHQTSGEGGFSLRGGLKDVGLILNAARNAGCSLEIASLVEAKLRLALERGFADADWSATQEVTRAQAGLDPR